MASVSAVEEQEQALLVVSDSTSEAPVNHARDIHILSLSFLLIFLAYGASQNLESSVNKDLGTTSLGILYLSFTVFSLVASPVVRTLGSKNALVLGTTGYWLFVASNLKPTWYTMIPASIYLGFSASIIWVGQATYLTSAACNHAKDFHLHEGEVIGSFNGEFWGLFASHQVVGNLISLALLKGGQETNYDGTTTLFVVFLVTMTFGSLLMCFLRKRSRKEHDLQMGSLDFVSSKPLLSLIIDPLFDKRMLLLIPLISYSGFQQAFVWAEFTKHVVTPALGVSGIGGAMAIYGTFDAICSSITGKLTTGFFSITLIVCGGAILHFIVLMCFLCNSSLTSGTSGSIYPLLLGAILGIGNGVFNTQLNASLGMLFKQDMEASFAQLKVWQCASIALVFFLSPVISFKAMVSVMVAVLCIATISFLSLTLLVQKVFSLSTLS